MIVTGKWERTADSCSRQQSSAGDINPERKMEGDSSGEGRGNGALMIFALAREAVVCEGSSASVAGIVVNRGLDLLGKLSYSPGCQRIYGCIECFGSSVGGGGGGVVGEAHSDVGLPR